MEKAYGELDKEDKGFLTYDELADKFLALGATLSKDDLTSLAADIDTDNDKKISKVLVTVRKKLRIWWPKVGYVLAVCVYTSKVVRAFCLGDHINQL